MGKKLMLGTVAVGAAYLLRNRDSRKKLMNQFQALGDRRRK